MVFTQFTDTMDYLRDQVVASGYSVMCYSGRGGEVRNTDGTWTSITRDEVKRRFKEGRSEVLVCTDAAAEGLNFQFCGALVNYVRQGFGKAINAARMLMRLWKYS
jgi:ERCC4-related helicase